VRRRMYRATSSVEFKCHGMDLNTMETGTQLQSTYTFSSYLTENEPEQPSPYIRLQTGPNVRFSAPYPVGTEVLSPG